MTLRGFESHSRRVEAQTFKIEGRAAVRSLALSAGISVLGMALLALRLVVPSLGEPAVWIGVALAGVGIGLVITAQEAARKSSVKAVLTDQGFTLISSRTRFELPWSDVRKVSMTANELIVRDKHRQEVKVISPPGSRPEQLDALAAAMAARLDASRGYRQALE